MVDLFHLAQPICVFTHESHHSLGLYPVFALFTLPPHEGELAGMRISIDPYGEKWNGKIHHLQIPRMEPNRTVGCQS